ncbi:MAG: acylglycerol kinase family protein, partial [Rikenellaceae bacterium]|nr:acylglycerol kinase family protein [Rikenellaceae bacterium]
MAVEGKWFTIVNPVAGQGRALDDLPTISRLLREYKIDCEMVFTERKHHATQLTVEAVRAGYRRVIVV